MSISFDFIFFKYGILTDKCLRIRKINYVSVLAIYKINPLSCLMISTTIIRTTFLGLVLTTELQIIRVNTIQTKKNSLTARLSVHKLMRDSSVKEQTLTVKFGDDLAEKTNCPKYNGYIVEDIDPFTELVRFTNGVKVEKGESIGEDKEAIFETQIRRTIEHILTDRNGLNRPILKCCRSSSLTKLIITHRKQVLFVGCSKNALTN